MMRCPICRREAQWEDNPFRPFCSERCQVIDLGAWASGAYAIPGKEESQSALFPEDPEVEP